MSNAIALHVIALRAPDGARIEIPPGAALPDWVSPDTSAELYALGAVAPSPAASIRVATKDAAETPVSEDGAADRTAPDAAHDAPESGAAEGARKDAPAGGKARTTRGRASA